MWAHAMLMGFEQKLICELRKGSTGGTRGGSCRVSCADVFRVDGAGGGDVVGAADDGPAVGEDRQNIIVDGQPQQEGILRDPADARQLLSQRGQAKVAAAPGASVARHSVRTEPPYGCRARRESQGNSPWRQVGQSAESRNLSSRTWRIWFSHRSMTSRFRCTASRVAGEDLDRLDGLDRGDHADDRRKDARRIAGRRGAGIGGLGHDAAKARSLAGQDGHRLPLGPQATAVDPGDAELHRGIVDQKAGLEIVGAIDDAIDAAHSDSIF